MKNRIERVKNTLSLCKKAKLEGPEAFEKAFPSDPNEEFYDAVCTRECADDFLEVMKMYEQSNSPALKKILEEDVNGYHSLAIHNLNLKVAKWLYPTTSDEHKRLEDFVYECNVALRYPKVDEKLVLDTLEYMFALPEIQGKIDMYLPVDIGEQGSPKMVENAVSCTVPILDWLYKKSLELHGYEKTQDEFEKMKMFDVLFLCNADSYQSVEDMLKIADYLLDLRRKPLTQQAKDTILVQYAYIGCPNVKGLDWMFNTLGANPMCDEAKRIYIDLVRNNWYGHTEYQPVLDLYIKHTQGKILDLFEEDELVLLEKYR